MAENFKKNIGTQGSEEARSYYSKYNIKQKFVFLELIFTSPEEHFQPFFKHRNLKILFGFWPNNFR